MIQLQNLRLLLGLLVLFLPLQYVLIVILHELGHVIAGVSSGAKFLGLRIRHVAFVRTATGMQIRRVPFPASDGQCFFLPARQKNGIIRMFYGGIMMHGVLIFSSIVVGFQGTMMIRMFFWTFALLNLASALLNLLPGRWLETDGQSARTIHSQQAASCFCKQMEIVQQLIEGVPYRDMNKELFIPPEGSDPINPYCLELSLFQYYYFLDIGNDSGAKLCLRKLLLYENQMSSWLRKELHQELQYFYSKDKGNKTKTCVRKPRNAMDLRFLLPVRRMKKLQVYWEKFGNHYLYPGELNSVKHILELQKGELT